MSETLLKLQKLWNKLVKKKKTRLGNFLMNFLHPHKTYSSM